MQTLLKILIEPAVQAIYEVILVGVNYLSVITEVEKCTVIMTYRNNFFQVVRRPKFITHEQVFPRLAEM
jgi:hypothetical protein